MTTHGACAGASQLHPSFGRAATRLGRNVAVGASSRVLGLALALICAIAPAGAQSLGSAIGDAAEGLQFRPSAPPAPDFVESARPDRLDYQRLAPTDKANHKKSAAELDALATSLDSARAANLRAAQGVRGSNQPAGAKTAKAKPDQETR
ncbi:MAG: hypothetical protein WAK01_06100 [Methylocystis sp.]